MKSVYDRINKSGGWGGEGGGEGGREGEFDGRGGRRGGKRGGGLTNARRGLGIYYMMSGPMRGVTKYCIQYTLNPFKKPFLTNLRF